MSSTAPSISLCEDNGLGSLHKISERSQTWSIMTIARRLAQVPLELRRVQGYLHSYETCGTVDGPGIRTVAFLQGCKLSCKYCHNPDTWREKTGHPVLVAEVLREIMAYSPYHESSGGGVTLSGGDPLAQPEFATALLQACRAAGIHSALDTSGGRPLDISQPVLDAADMVLLDIKHTDPKTHQWLTGVPLVNSLATGDYLAANNKRTWIRHVVVPGITSSDQHFDRLAEIIGMWGNVERVDLLAYHDMAISKWEALGIPYALKGTPNADEDLMNHARARLQSKGLPVP